MYHREFPVTATQQATNGALDIFVEGCRKENLRAQLFGLSILRDATEAQIRAAMPVVQASQRVTEAEIAAMFAR